jgi:hypothetical protein
MSDQYMSNRLVEVIQELRDYPGPEAHGLSAEAAACARRGAIHPLSELIAKEAVRQEEPERYGQL